VKLGRSRPPSRRARVIHGPLTAAARQVGPRNAERLQRLIQPWQARALSFYDTCGECWYPAQGYARSLKRIRFFPGFLNERGEIEEADDGPLVELFDRVQDPGGGRSELQGAYGRLWFLIGDGRLTVTQQDGQEAWEFLSPAELRIVPGTLDPVQYLRFRAPGLAPEDLMDAPDDAFEPMDDQARVYRLWNRHPTYTDLADSPVKGVLELYELLQWLTAAASANAASRTANRGAFYLPEELDFGQNDVDEPDEDPQNDPFFQELIEVLSKAISNPGTAEAAAPLVIRGKAMLPHPDGLGATPMVDLMRWFPMGPDSDYSELDASVKVISRIANGLDLPVDWVTGNTGDVNHWSGWLVDEQGFRMHIAPVADSFARDLNAAYLRPAAIEAGIPDAERVAVGYDPAAAINHPDEIQTARDAYKDGVVGPTYYRDKIGASDDAAPSEDELAIIFALQKATLPGEEPAETAPQDGGMGGDVDETVPATEEDTAVSASALQAAHVLGALNLTVHRGRELAGSRLRTKTQGCQPCKEALEGVPTALVASTLGRERIREELNGHGEEHSLVAGAADGFAATVTRWGVPADIALELGRLAEQHALRTLYEPDPPPLPAGVQAVVVKAIR
jgi:hypothetical protein